jgi:hypothetical protein
MPSSDTRALIRSTKAAVVSKVIDITPDSGQKSKQSAFPEALKSLSKYRNFMLAGAWIAGAAIVAILAIHPGKHPVATAATPPAPKVSVAPAAIPAQPLAAQAAQPIPAQQPPAAKVAPKPLLVELDLPTAVQQGLLQCQWRGNGKDRLFLDARSLSKDPLRLHLDAGQLLASTDSTIVILASQTLEFAPGAAIHQEIRTVATASANKVVGAEYHLSEGTLPDLDKLFAYLAAHQTTRQAAVQTATLILTENLPLSAFAKFNELTVGAVAMPDSTDFKADTVDILSALSIIRNIGISRPLAVTIDPQLEIEAMIDPDAHAAAIQYYGITDEWAFWKNQLLQGDPTTRHYALYGIARYYPDVALQMLPNWARRDTVSSVFRISAVQALAQTNRPEAVPILRELERELGSTTDLGKAAHQGANYLDAEFAHTASVASTGN